MRGGGEGGEGRWWEGGEGCEEGTEFRADFEIEGCVRSEPAHGVPLREVCPDGAKPEVKNALGGFVGEEGLSGVGSHCSCRKCGESFYIAL